LRVTVARICALPSRAFARYRIKMVKNENRQNQKSSRAFARYRIKIVQNENRQMKNRQNQKSKIVRIKNRRAHLRVTIARICALPSRAFARYRYLSKIVKNENHQIKNRRAHLRITVTRICALPYQNRQKMKIVKIKNRRAHLRVTVARICALPSRAFARYRYRIKNSHVKNENQKSHTPYNIQHDL
jgi:hypothetical protein